MLATLGPRMRAVEKAGPAILHTDTTTFALFEDYPSQETGPTVPVVLTWGHSKDHRPDLRHMMAGLTVDQDGYVVGGTMLSGNPSDRAWHPAWWDQLEQAMPEGFWQDGTYVADSALIAERALQKIGALGMHGLARLPATLGLCDRWKAQAWANPDASWVPLGTLAEKEHPTSATYQAQTLDATVYGQPARAFVYPSSALDRKNPTRWNGKLRGNRPS